jgi:hypothetical protein
LSDKARQVGLDSNDKCELSLPGIDLGAFWVKTAIPLFMHGDSVSLLQAFPHHRLETSSQAGRQTGRQASRQAGRETDRQTDR